MIPSHCEYNLPAANMSIWQDRKRVGDRVFRAGRGPMDSPGFQNWKQVQRSGQV